MVRVEVVYCAAPGQADLSTLWLEPGCTVRAALLRSGLLQRHGLDIDAVDAGVWFKACSLDQPLRDGDQVQLYRPLTVDPKEARRLRYRRRAPGRSDT